MSWHAAVRRDGRFWFVEVEGVGVTQARHLRELESMTVDLIEVMTGCNATPDDITFEIELPDSVSRHLERAQRLRSAAAQSQSEAAAELRAAARELVDAEMSLRDVGRVLGVSHQRAHQLVSD